jgi:hypothetical protein
MGEIVLGRMMESEGTGSSSPKQAPNIRSKPKHRNQMKE